ncbi:hypothetical protein [Noviherbaspirillum suwonense]|uniref:hypothetical protein n=1 Tax=Noviherbaspirillum suwonense TaxID=1224511 RepID=UPI0024B684C0|nr:hypothetical protein [Noviherbaspirillum suwonense]
MKLVSLQQHACQQRFSLEIQQNDGFSVPGMERWRREMACQAIWHRKMRCHPMLAPAANPPGPGAA